MRFSASGKSSVSSESISMPPVDYNVSAHNRTYNPTGAVINVCKYICFLTTDKQAETGFRMKKTTASKPHDITFLVPQIHIGTPHVP